MIENLFPPIPSEIILTLSGFLCNSTNLTIPLIILASTLGSLIGAIILYYMGYFLNIKIFKLLHIKEENINNTLKSFNDHGNISVLIGRLIPIIRSLISIPAGIFKMNIYLFIILTTIGSLIWNTILILLGNMLGENYYLISRYISNYYKPIIIFIIILFIIIKLIKKRRKTPIH